MKNELSPIQVLIRQTAPQLRDLAVATIHSEGTDSSSATTDPSYRNTGDYSNAETASIKSGRKLFESIETQWSVRKKDSILSKMCTFFV